MENHDQTMRLSFNSRQDLQYSIEKENQHENPDLLWESKQYKRLLSLLLKDSNFPDNFDLKELNEDIEEQRNLKAFALEKNLLHQWITENKFDKVKKYTSAKKSSYHFNDKNVSAACTALHCRNLKIYAFLRSINVNLAEHESDIENELSDLEKNELRDIKFRYYTQSDNAHILHIISKLRINSQKLVKNREEIEGYVHKLDQVQDVSIILKVIKYVDNLDLVLDLDNDNVKVVCPSATTSDRGLTLDNLSTVYVAAGGKRSENEILGTLAHELTHMAMKIIFENDCNPYCKSDDSIRDEFKNIVEPLEGKIELLGNELARTLSDAFGEGYKYTDSVENEVIARVPQILAQYPEGREWLENHTPELLQFYTSKVIPKCEKFIKDNHHLSKLKNWNRSMNKGEILHLQKWNLFFSDISDVKAFLSKPRKRIFAFITKYPWLGTIRVLQGNYGVFYTDFCDRFLVFKIKNAVKNFEAVKYLFNSEATEILIIECSDDLLETNELPETTIESLIEIIKGKTLKKIIFIMKENKYQHLRKIVKKRNMADLFEEKIDKETSLFDIDFDSREKILYKVLLFQGKETTLSELTPDEDLLRAVNADIIKELLEDKKIEIFSKTFGTSSLEGAYADVVLEVNLNALKKEIKYGHDIFIFQSIQENELIEILNVEKSEIYEFKDYNHAISISRPKIIYFTNHTTDKDFKKLCSYFSDKKIYLLNTAIENNKLTFILVKFYNPIFYFPRKYLKRTILKKEICKKKSDAQIIVSNGCNSELNDDELNIHRLNPEEAELRFQEFCKLNKNVHLVEDKNDKFVWIKSYGSLSPLRLYVEENLNEENQIGEKELIQSIQNEKVLIFADDPGMGKSTSLTKLLETRDHFVNFFDSHWLMRLNLKDHLRTIKNINDENLNLNDVITFLIDVNPSLQKGIGKILLELALDNNKRFCKPLLVAFDGFDELLDKKDREKILVLLKFLKNETKSKIWVTTRLHFKETLEDELSTFAIRFVPVDGKSKFKFIRDYLKIRLKLILSEETFSEVFEHDRTRKNPILGKYVEEFINKTESIFQGEPKTMIGTPLQLHLMLEGSLKFFQDWIENPKKRLDFSYLGSNLLEVYEQFFERKFEILFRKMNILEEAVKFCIKDSFDKYHEQLAASLILKEKRFENVDNYTTFILSLGISKMTGNNIEFFHFTFREYFFAQLLFKNLSNHRYYLTYEEAGNLFWQTILVNNEYQLIRNFLNNYFRRKETRELLKSRKELCGVKCWKAEGSDICGFCVAVVENHDYLLETLFTIDFIHFKGINILMHKEFCKRKISFLVVEKKNDFALNLIFELASQFTESEQYELLSIVTEYEGTVLHSAVIKKNDFALNQIIKMASKHSVDQQYKFLSFVNIYGGTALHLAVERKNDEALKRILEVMLNFRMDQKFELLSRKNKINQTVLHLAVLKTNDNALSQILNYVSKFNLDLQYKLLCITNEHQETALHLAIKGKNFFYFNHFIDMLSKYNAAKQYHLINIANNSKETVYQLAKNRKKDLKIQSNQFLNALMSENLKEKLNFAKRKFIFNGKETLNEPVEKSILKLPCPRSISGPCQKDLLEWNCFFCGDILEYDFDNYFYCRCGKEPSANFQFKCYSPEHGDKYISLALKFPLKRELNKLQQQINKMNKLVLGSSGDRTFPLRQELSKLQPLEEMNILILGQSGVGKSTWINSIANYFQYKTLEEAQKGGVICAIPASFSVLYTTHEKVVKQRVTVGNADPNETTDVGKSATKDPKTYNFVYNNRAVRLIDTPGLGDKNGYEQGKENMRKIVDHIGFLKEIHGICILLKSNEIKFDVTFRFCINELLTHLHRNAARNIIFCFTHSRSAFYSSGDTSTVLENLLKDLGLSTLISLNKNTAFCLDNEAFRYLCSLQYKNIPWTAENEKIYKQSWTKSVEETRRLFGRIEELKPHIVADTTIICHARNRILNLMKPMVEITQAIQSNLVAIKIEEKKISENNESLEKLAKKLRMPQIMLELEPLPFPRTVCTSPKCVKYVHLEHSNTTMVEYTTICHDHCFCPNVISEVYPNEALRTCHIFNYDPIRREKCGICGCRWDSHMNITYNKKRVEKYVNDPNIEDEINSKKDAAAKIEEHKRQLVLKTEEYKHEKNTITQTSLKFAAFLRENCITPYNDAFKEYLKYLIKLETDRANKTEVDNNIIQNLKDTMRDYEELVKIMDESLKNKNFENVSAKDIKNLEQELYNLKLTGKQIKKSMQVSTASELADLRYKEVNLPIRKWVEKEH